jgi:hypothetical protein
LAKDGRRHGAKGEREKEEEALAWGGVREEGPRVRRGRGGGA